MAKVPKAGGTAGLYQNQATWVRDYGCCPNSLTILMMCTTYGKHEDGEAPLETPGVLGRLAQSACC